MTTKQQVSYVKNAFLAFFTTEDFCQLDKKERENMVGLANHCEAVILGEAAIEDYDTLENVKAYLGKVIEGVQKSNFFEELEIFDKRISLALLNNLVSV